MKKIRALLFLTLPTVLWLSSVPSVTSCKNSGPGLLRPRSLASHRARHNFTFPTAEATRDFSTVIRPKENQ